MSLLRLFSFPWLSSLNPLTLPLTQCHQKLIKHHLSELFSDLLDLTSSFCTTLMTPKYNAYSKFLYFLLFCLSSLLDCNLKQSPCITHYWTLELVNCLTHDACKITYWINMILWLFFWWTKELNLKKKKRLKEETYLQCTRGARWRNFMGRMGYWRIVTTKTKIIKITSTLASNQVLWIDYRRQQ